MDDADSDAETTTINNKSKNRGIACGMQIRQVMPFCV